MNEFLIGLQFLTRISVVRQTVWTEESFGGSVKFFPLVGAVLGICYAAATGGLIFLTNGGVPLFTGAVGFFLSVWLTGAIHCDGLMDSADGLFSGREREKMLEIMKDSRAGAFGVVALVLVAALQVTALAELVRISAAWTIAAVFSAPVIGRLAMVLVIALFPYARPAGIGKSFAKFTTRKTLAVAAIEAILLLTPVIFFSVEIFLTSAVALVVAVISALEFGKFATGKLGGVTGDIYGAAEILAETLVLAVFLLAAV